MHSYNGKRKRRRRVSTFRVFVLVLLVLGIVFAIVKLMPDKLGEGFAGLFEKDIMESVTPMAGGDSEFSKAWPDSKRVNMLLLGTNQELTDTIMLASFDTELKRVDVISVPRDTYYERPDYPGPAYQKINSVYETEGVDGIAKAVSDVLGGVPVHYYAVITDDGVARVVNAMGGVEMDVPIDMQYDDPEQGLHIDLKQGLQTLDGDQAVQYLRFRKGYPTGDLGRVDAQQAFLKQVFDRTISLSFPKVAAAFIAEVETNIGAEMMVRLGKAAVGMDKSAFATYTTPGESDMQDGASYYFADEALTMEMMTNIYSMKAEETE
ncbi:MAG: LCP family protein [Clostridiales Family XIII bacterium]|jgi:LCP family protein required for cell wall assembly|nr:LCP family protein [Clostridiales Family XIII bacterium]